MEELKSLWEETEEFIEKREEEIVEKYINFLREVAQVYLKKENRIFFKENRVVHYGECGFGWMIIESDDDPFEIFGNYIPEIRFKPQISQKEERNYTEIRKENLEDIKYEVK